MTPDQLQTHMPVWQAAMIALACVGVGFVLWALSRVVRFMLDVLRGPEVIHTAPLPDERNSIDRFYREIGVEDGP